MQQYACMMQGVPYPAYSCTVAALQTTPLSLHRFCADCPPTHSLHHMCKSPRSQSSGQRAVSVHWRECLDHRRSQLQEGWEKMSGGRKRIHYTHMDINEWDSPTAIETMEHAWTKLISIDTFHNSVMECCNKSSENSTYSCKLEVFQTNVRLTGRNGFGNHSTGSQNHICTILHFQNFGWIQCEIHLQVSLGLHNQPACTRGGFQSTVQLPGTSGFYLLSEHTQGCRSRPLWAGNPCESRVSHHWEEYQGHRTPPLGGYVGERGKVNNKTISILHCLWPTIWQWLSTVHTYVCTPPNPYYQGSPLHVHY